MNGMLIVAGTRTFELFVAAISARRDTAPRPNPRGEEKTVVLNVVMASPDPISRRLRRTPFLFRFRIPMVLTDGPKVPAVFGAVGQLLRHPHPAVPPSPAFVLAARLAGAMR